MNIQRQKFINEAKFGFTAERAVSLAYSQQPRPLMSAFGRGAFQVSGLLSEAWIAANNIRRSRFDTINDVMMLPIAKTIVKQMAFDAMNPDSKGDVIKIVAVDKDKGTQKKYQEEIDRLGKSYDFNSLVMSLVRDLINFGEQAVRLSVKQGDGVTGIYNDVDLLNLVALYEQGVPKSYLKFQDNAYYMFPAASYAHFVAGSNTIRVKLEDRLVAGYSLIRSALSFNTQGAQATKIPKWAADELPDFIQMGEPLFDGFVNKIRELQLLESLVVATKLNQITQSSVLGVPVDKDQNPDEVTKTMREWEDRLNSPISIDFTKSQIGIADVIGTTGILKCVPIFGDQSIQALGVRNSIPVDDLIKAINDVRRMITSNLGVPYTLIYGADTDSKDGGAGNKTIELRSHGRYVRTLSTIQLAVRNGIRQIVLTHMKNRGPEYSAFTKDSFDLEFVNPMPDILELERLEIIDAKNAIAMDLLEGVLKYYSNPVTALMVEPQALMDKLREDMELVSPGHKIIKKQAPLELYDTGFLMSLRVAGGGEDAIGPADTQPKNANEEHKRLENRAQKLLLEVIQDPILQSRIIEAVKE